MQVLAVALFAAAPCAPATWCRRVHRAVLCKAGCRFAATTCTASHVHGKKCARPPEAGPLPQEQARLKVSLAGAASASEELWMVALCVMSIEGRPVALLALGTGAILMTLGAGTGVAAGDAAGTDAAGRALGCGSVARPGAATAGSPTTAPAAGTAAAAPPAAGAGVSAEGPGPAATGVTGPVAAAASAGEEAEDAEVGRSLAGSSRVLVADPTLGCMLAAS